jgi:bifunctional UDP-N-acetylglucosamine pyrophosphorylase/glucosamine-1-phosphate N-acetyltransferase
MFVAEFPQTVVFSETQALRAAFGADCLYLRRDASLSFSGEISLGPNVVFGGDCSLAGPMSIETGSVLTDVRLGPNTRVREHSVMTAVVAGESNLFGPFCFIRDGCSVGDNVILGAHVEAARSSFASGVKVSHRAFIGDATVGAQTILGAGVVFCNYDGKGRQATVVGDEVVVGSGTMLVPPIRIGDRATIAAGSVITRDVGAGVRVIQKR